MVAAGVVALVFTYVARLTGNKRLAFDEHHPIGHVGGGQFASTGWPATQ